MNFFKFKPKNRYNIKVEVEEFTQLVLIHLFPEMLNQRIFDVSSNKIYRKLIQLLSKQISNKSTVDLIAKKFTSDLPLLQKELIADARFIAQNDPAASSANEVIITYPGFSAICIYRLANSIASEGVPLIPRIMTEWAHSRTGIDIHPKATIGKEFFIDHGTGIVIGETAVIGNRVKIYQGVTIGALSVNKDFAKTKRHPTIEDDVVIYAGSTILGGSTVIGHNSIIGGNVWLTKSVEPNSLVYHESKIIVRERELINEE